MPMVFGIVKYDSKKSLFSITPTPSRNVIMYCAYSAQTINDDRPEKKICKRITNPSSTLITQIVSINQNKRGADPIVLLAVSPRSQAVRAQIPRP